MEVGFLTACMGKEPLESVVAWAGQAGVRRVEIILSHLGEDTPARDKAVLKALRDAGVAPSSIAHYDGKLLAKDRAEAVKALKASVDRCIRLGTDVLCSLTGLPPDGMSKEDAIDGPVAAIFAPVCEYAASRGVRVALENWTATCIQHFDQWDRLLEKVPAPNLGFNYDPSHLLWQGIDYLGGVEKYGARIFHAHAKDTEVRDEVLRRVGNQGRGWWRYCIPGQGRVRWGEFIARLRRVKFNGVLSIEHEDSLLPPRDGVVLGKKFLEQYI
jgi:sugar phosphate isomerase/epimerase